MIKKSILSTIILLVLYTCFIFLHPMWGVATHQRQENYIKAQKYIYEIDCDTVIVGSSLSARIISHNIPSVYILSFSGRAVADGLRIISYKKKKPKYVLIETNLLLKEYDPATVSALTEGPLPILRRYLPSLREQYEPICIVAQFMMEPPSGSTRSATNSELLDILIQKRIADDSLMSQRLVDSRVKDLKSLMYYLEDKGTTFFFFEMPINERISHLNQYEQVRRVLKKEFPPSEYRYLPFDTTHYQTTDGIHLNYREQQLFTQHFKEMLTNYPFK